MKTIEQIKKQMRSIDWIIDNHKNQIEYYSNDDFDIDKIIDYSNKIKLLQTEKVLLEWVLSDS